MCECRIDYSTIEGNRILPFIFSLDEENSNLYPTQGEYQTFCYDIIGAGQDESRFADLSHFLLGVCDQINQSDIAEIAVTINGEPQKVIWGNNVEIKTREKPDKPTGGVGLKFDFPLDKVTGDMQIRIALNKQYRVGPTNVWIFGGGVTATGLEICGPLCAERRDTCEYVFRQRETVSVPVHVTPYATVGTTRVSCCSSPVIRTGAQSVNTQCEVCREACNFSISQSLCVEIPIAFGTDVEIGEAIIQCGDISDSGCSCDQ